jgi:hypothetical protein
MKLTNSQRVAKCVKPTFIATEMAIYTRYVETNALSPVDLETKHPLSAPCRISRSLSILFANEEIAEV